MTAAGAGRPTVVVVTGLSGAGKTTALHTLEDLGFFCVDNLPTLLAPQAVKLCEEGGMTRVALGMDVRVRAFLGAMGHVLEQLGDGGRRDVQVVFLDASDDALLRRFSESRRPHPVSTITAGGDASGATLVLDGIMLERERLAPLRAQATRVLDTTHLSVHELRRAIVTQLGPAAPGATRMLTRILSFGFKYGTPVDADVLLDVRFLDNPYFIPELKPLPGTDPRVSSYVLSLPEAKGFLEKTRDLLAFVMPKYEREGKSYFTLALGCTGGRHRSVALAEQLAKDLGGASVLVAHRDLGRDSKEPREVAPTSTRRPNDSMPPSDETPEIELRGSITPAPITASTRKGLR